MNEGLHSQNWRLEVKRGEKAPELGLDGLAMDRTALQKQLEDAQKALANAQADREDANDQPQLSENSQIKAEDLPVASAEDKAFLDREVEIAQEKVDRIQAKLEVMDITGRIEEAVKMLESQVGQLNEKSEAVKKLKSETESLLGSEGAVDGFDAILNQIEDAILEKKSDRAGLGVYLVLNSANLRGEISDEDREKLRDILKVESALLHPDVRDRAVRIAEKTKASQIKDAKELLEFKAEASKLKGLEKERLNREIVLLKKILEKAGVNTDDEQALADLAGIELSKVKIEVNEPPEIEEEAPLVPEADQAEVDFRSRYFSGRELLTDLETNIDPLVATEVNRIIPLLEAILTGMDAIIGQIKDAGARDKAQKAWERMDMAKKVREAKEKVAPAAEVATPEASEESTVEETATEAAPTDEVGEESEDQQETALPVRTKIWNSITKTFTGITGWIGKNLGGRDESEGQATSTNETQVNAPTAVIEKKMSSKEIFDLQLRSLGRIETNLRNILFRKDKDTRPPSDAEAFAFALDSLYMTDLEVVNNNEGTNLNSNHQERLNAVIDRISGVLQENIGKNWDQIVVDMENAVPEKGTLLDETEDRKKWFVQLYNGEQATEPVASPDSEQVEAELPPAPAEMPDMSKDLQDSVPGLDNLNL